MRPSSSATTKKREVLSREARIQSILEASQRVFSSRPYDEISIDEIVAEASMSKGLLYHYFSSKRDLYLETLRSVFATMSQIPQASQDLHTCLQAFLSYFEHYPALTRMVFRGGIGSDTEAEELLTSYRQRQFAIFLHYAGNNTTDPLVQLALRGWISFYQEVCLEWLEHQDISRDQLLALLEQSLRAIQSLTQNSAILHPQNPREEAT